MAKIRSNLNTRSGGQPAPAAFRGIVGDPNGNREERRAWRRLQKPGRQTGAIRWTAETPAESEVPDDPDQ